MGYTYPFSVSGNAPLFPSFPLLRSSRRLCPDPASGHGLSPFLLEWDGDLTGLRSLPPSEEEEYVSSPFSFQFESPSLIGDPRFFYPVPRVPVMTIYSFFPLQRVTRPVILSLLPFAKSPAFKVPVVGFPIG